MPVEVRILGPVSVMDDDGSSVVVRSAQQRLILAVLTAARGRTVAADVLAESLWADDLPADPSGALQSHVSRLRRQLGRSAPWIETTVNGYRFAPPSEAVDASRFETLLDDALELTDDASAAVDRLDAALALWRGRAYGEFSSHPAVAAEATRLEELRAQAAELRADRLIKADRAAEAAAAMRALIDEHPFRERPVAVLMRALASDGRHAEALDSFERFRRLLDNELGLEPSPELRTVEAEILRHDKPTRGVIGLPGNSFVGRETEVAKTTWLLERHRLVTLTGAGGVGKTRVALHVASGLASAYADGVYLCELARVSEPAAVNAAVASTMHVDEQAGRPLVTRLVEFLQAKQALLVLDNCEHVIDSAAQLITTILRGTANVDILATSRERLGVEGEERVAVGPLATPAWDDPTGPSVVLFSDRARAVAPDLTLAEADIASVCELCRRLDGLPLAIELAAAQTVWSSPSEILDAISDRLGDLADRKRTVERHRSLDAVFRWSYDLLKSPERSVFEELAVFAGGWTSEAAAEVAGATADVLATLVEHSLVTPRPSGARVRFFMLEPIRQYAEARLEERGIAKEARARHTAWAVVFAQDADAGLRGPKQRDWHIALEAEHANLRVAHAWCLANDADASIRLAGSLYQYIRCGAVSEVFAWAQEAVASFSGGSHPRLPDACAAAAIGSSLRGDIAGARRWIGTGIAQAKRDPVAARLCWLALGDAENFSGNFEQAVSCYDRAIDLAREAGDDFCTAFVLCDRAMSTAYSGAHEQAIHACEAVAPLVAGLNNPTLTAHWNYTNGEVRLDHAPLKALPYFRRSVAEARRVGDRLCAGLAGLSAVSCEARVGDPTKALIQYRDLIDHWHRAGAWNMQWATLRTLIELLARLGRDAEATVLYSAMLTSPTAPPVAGMDVRRIASAVDALRLRLGDERFETLRMEGAALSDNEAVALALSCVGGSASALTVT